jgi:hypothetical protein
VRVPLFYLDDKEYLVPKHLPPAVGLRYLRDIRDGRGLDGAVAELLTEAIGEEGFDALCDHDAIDRDQMSTIVDRVLQIALGGVGADDKGKS